MANLVSNPSNNPIPQLEITDVALAGPGKTMNAQAQALLNKADYIINNLTPPFANDIQIHDATVGTPTFPPMNLSWGGMDGVTYKIVTVGTSNFMAYGAASNTVGTVFVASNFCYTDPGNGTVILVAGNTALGHNALANTYLPFSTGTGNTAIGTSALATNTQGAFNVAVGHEALINSINGGWNIGIGGDKVLNSNTSGSYNIGIGYWALKSNVTGMDNIAIGDDCISSMTVGQRNVGIGLTNFATIADGRDNIAIGSYNLGSAFGLDGGGNIARDVFVNAYNIAIGVYCLNSMNSNPLTTPGKHNIAIGDSALWKNTLGDKNIALGAGALLNTATTSGNIALGTYGTSTLTIGGNNTSIGNNALMKLNNGLSNVGVGTQAGMNIVTGDTNIFIGNNSGLGVIAGSNNVIIGGATGGTLATLNNTVIISDGVGTERIHIDNLGSCNIIGSLKVNGVAVSTRTDYDVRGSTTGIPAANAIISTLPTVRAYSLPTNLVGSVAVASVAATASTVFTLKKNNVSIGTMTFAATGTLATFVVTATSFIAGDILTVVAPATPDATLANIGFTFAGTLV